MTEEHNFVRKIRFGFLLVNIKLYFEKWKFFNKGTLNTGFFFIITNTPLQIYDVSHIQLPSWLTEALFETDKRKL